VSTQLRIPIFLAASLFLLSNPSLGEGLRGVFTCSSNSGGRPVVYAFDDKLMIRDQQGALPFSFIGKISERRLLYSGHTQSSLFSQWARQYGAVPESLEIWAPKGLLPDFNPSLLTRQTNTRSL
jgi:hypothetical protein